MLNSLKQNVLFLIFLVLTGNVLMLSVSNVSAFLSKSQAQPAYEVIDCGDATERSTNVFVSIPRRARSMIRRRVRAIA